MQINPSQCSVDPPQVNGEPELYGLNWELAGGASIVGFDLLDPFAELYFEIPSYNTDLATPFARSIQSFQRPLEVSVEMRVKPGTSANQCLSLDLFASSACYASKKKALHQCGYQAGIGGYDGKSYYANENEFSGTSGPIAKVDTSQWHTVTIMLLQDGTNEYYLNDVRQRSTTPSTTSKYVGSVTEGQIALHGCGMGQY